MDNLLKEISKLYEQKQNKKFDQLNTTLAAVQAQTSKIDETITFFSLKYDELFEHLESFERINSALKKQMFDLESKVEWLERQLRSATIEIKTIPLSDHENKDSLITNICKIATVIDQSCRMTLKTSTVRNLKLLIHPVPSLSSANRYHWKKMFLDPQELSISLIRMLNYQPHRFNSRARPTIIHFRVFNKQR